MKAKLAFGAMTGLAAGVGLSAYQYFGPLGYVGLKAGLGLFGVNLAVGVLGGFAGGLIWGRRGLGRMLVGILACATITVGWGYWNMRQDFNVVVLVADAVRADHVSAYGYQRETTPNWDALARGEGGVLFQTAIAQGTATMSGGPVLFTGLYQSQTGYLAEDYLLPQEVTTLAETMQQCGYTTYATISNPHLSEERGFAQGFHVFADTLSWDEAPGGARIAYDFARWYEAERPRQLFALLFFIETHAPYRAPLEQVRRFRPDYRVADRHRSGEAMKLCQGAEREDVIALYDAGLAVVDRACATALQALERAGALDRTLVVVTTDHGEALWEHGLSGHGKKPYEHQVCIPLVMRFPSPVRFPRVRPVARVSQQPTGQVDIMPTILEFIGASRRDVPNGESVLPYVFGRRAENRDRGLLTQHLRPQTCYYAWRKGDHKVIVTESESGNVKLELYDLVADPEEKANLATSEARLADALRAEMESELARAQTYACTPETTPLSPEERKRLKSLGYLD